MKAVHNINSSTNNESGPELQKSLLDAAAKADVQAFLGALQAGADPNAEDRDGRTAIGCAIAGERSVVAARVRLEL